MSDKTWVEISYFDVKQRHKVATEDVERQIRYAKRSSLKDEPFESFVWSMAEGRDFVRLSARLKQGRKMLFRISGLYDLEGYEKYDRGNW